MISFSKLDSFPSCSQESNYISTAKSAFRPSCCHPSKQMGLCPISDPSWRMGLRPLVLGWQALLRRSPTPGSCHGPVDRWASWGLAHLTRVAVNSGWTSRGDWDPGARGWLQGWPGKTSGMYFEQLLWPLYASAALSSFRDAQPRAPSGWDFFIRQGSPFPSWPASRSLGNHLPMLNAEFRAAKLIPKPRGPRCLPPAPLVFLWF